jgi:hypothetical protein
MNCIPLTVLEFVSYCPSLSSIYSLQFHVSSLLITALFFSNCFLVKAAYPPPPPSFTKLLISSMGMQPPVTVHASQAVQVLCDNWVSSMLWMLLRISDHSKHCTSSWNLSSHSRLSESSVLWDIISCSQLLVNGRCGGICRFHRQCRRKSQARNESESRAE